MADLIACGRVFWHVINATAEWDADGDMDLLNQVDDHLCLLIANRQAVTPQEFAAKAEYLLARIQNGSMADVAEKAAMASIRADACRAIKAAQAEAVRRERTGTAGI
ncbi:hypothetical protein [Siccirubricoccus phaeus]|uniref:hypothetical protein n=1 Tax=Siccirubricoccus phaeus TaxID=2595053 RepID=UPI0011F253C4|nr:hypothetical protein [Siccirubricoccus phaeus]